MKKYFELLSNVIIIIIGWFVIQHLFATIPFDNQDLTVEYFTVKIVTESIYVITTVIVAIYQMSKLFKSND